MKKHLQKRTVGIWKKTPGKGKHHLPKLHRSSLGQFFGVTRVTGAMAPPPSSTIFHPHICWKQKTPHFGWDKRTHKTLPFFGTRGTNISTKTSGDGWVYQKNPDKHLLGSRSQNRGLSTVSMPAPNSFLLHVCYPLPQWAMRFLWFCQAPKNEETTNKKREQKHHGP